MELEQLVSFVRHERGKLSSWVALDDVLTALQESKTKVAETEAQVKAAEQRLAELNKQCEDKLAHLEARASAVEAGIAQKKAEYIESLDKAAKAAAAERDAKVKEVADLHIAYEKVKAQINNMSAEVRLLDAAKAQGEKDLALVKAKLAEISKSIAQ
jgi:chromosome segregation ATPase